jgi:hypothetical protein
MCGFSRRAKGDLSLQLTLFFQMRLGERVG